MINQLALTDDVEGLWSVESRNPSSAKAFLHDQDPEQTFIDCALHYSDLIFPLRTGKRRSANKDPVQLRVALPAANPPDNPANKPSSSLVISRA
jgi:hypothetical protein